jgi:hypothetical protein
MLLFSFNSPGAIEKSQTTSIYHLHLAALSLFSKMIEPVSFTSAHLALIGYFGKAFHLINSATKL